MRDLGNCEQLPMPSNKPIKGIFGRQYEDTVRFIAWAQSRHRPISLADHEDVSTYFGVSQATAYRWINSYLLFHGGTQ